MDRRPRRLLSVAIGLVAFVAGYLFLFPSGCLVLDGVPSWERCLTTVETPAVSLDWGLDPTFDILIPLAVAVLAGLATWWVLGLRNSPHVPSRRSWLTILMALLAILAVAATVDLINGTYVYPDCPEGAIPPGTACA